jgi:hypothetical protein
MNHHLEFDHGVTKEQPYGEKSGTGVGNTTTDSPIHAAFAKSIQRLQFNSDLFKALLIRWICFNNISFRVVEQPTCRLLLSYLMACVS